jgi:hypothetical protein
MSELLAPEGAPLRCLLGQQEAIVDQLPHAGRMHTQELGGFLAADPVQLRPRSVRFPTTQASATATCLRGRSAKRPVRLLGVDVADVDLDGVWVDETAAGVENDHLIVGV